MIGNCDVTKVRVKSLADTLVTSNYDESCKIEYKELSCLNIML